jgi:EF-P beta-lysylation protein EpmB
MEKWRMEQRKGFSSPLAIADFLELSGEMRARVIQRKDFPLHIPLRIAEKMPKGCISNPLALQFLPLDDELKGGGMVDPVGDMGSQKCDALLHKYEGRALLLTTGACAMHCRYCFRQNYPYQSSIDEAIALIGKDSSIKEVILSGGDPLSLSDKSLKDIMLALEAISHVKIIRFHTRFLVGIPERVTAKFLDMLDKCSKQVVFVLHVNCVEELDEVIFGALDQIRALNIPVLTQSVLLKGVNDSKPALYDLFWKLSTRGVIPYYLHQLDRVKGSLHFEVPKDKGFALIKSLRDCLPGYAVPLFVQEIEGKPSKTIINL